MSLAIQTILVFGLTLICGYFGLPYIRELKLGQQVREEGPKTHYVKSGTPTFGGFFFLIPIIIVSILRLVHKPSFEPYYLVLLLVLGFGAVGFADDYIKVRINRDGLSVIQKTIPLFLLTVAFAVYYLFLSPEEPFIRMPFTGDIVYFVTWTKVLYLIFIILYLFFLSNSVNISDGLDGLCSGLVIFSSLGLAAAMWFLDANMYGPLIEWALILVAGCLGFLFFNHHPAKIFMGDLGSLSLGAALASISLLAGLPWLMAINAVVIVAEGLSSFMQTTYYKLSGGKRIFRMAPLHHHYELGGWEGTKVVRVFWLAQAIASALSLIII